jgi:alanyl-tRNA synthetase
VAPEKLRFDFSHKTAVSDAELKRIEDSSNKYIEQNTQVYATDVPLPTARNIEGVRAVFGETYPDPVRVVSIGVPVEDLLQDVKNSEWMNLSIEFCGGTHVDKTGEIKKLIILEESGIAKGIRRIVAVTGQDAFEVERQASDFEQRLEHLERMSFGPEKEALAKIVQADLNGLSISSLTKVKLKNKFAVISKSIIDQQKAIQKAEQKQVLDAVLGHFMKEDNKGKQHAVLRLPYSPSISKTFSEIFKYLGSKEKNKTVYLFAADESDGKVVHGCFVGEVCINIFHMSYRLINIHFSNILLKELRRMNWPKLL